MANIAAYAWEKGLTKQVVYRAADGHIHELLAQNTGEFPDGGYTGSQYLVRRSHDYSDGADREYSSPFEIA